ncbi:MAG: 2Fe-2S iron-sulfur cluster-binding protein [Polaromonas sp.]|nr:2Fe-2S iron-sulfur cluster-binding protein [Polaromonas sp.]
MPPLPAPPVFHVRLQTGGPAFAAPTSLPVLQSALAAGVWIESSCRNGTCRSCICRLASGQVVYRMEWPGLSAEEKADGYILPCVAYPASDLVIQAPAQES